MAKIETVLPQKTRTRKTEGSRRLLEYNEQRGAKHVPWYIPLELHKALKLLAIYRGTSLQTMVTYACEQHYGDLKNVVVPPLTVPTRINGEPHKNYGWYAPIELATNIARLSVELEASRQQLITSAVVNQYKSEDPIARLQINTGSAPYVRAPANLPISFQAGQVRRKTG